MSDNYTIRVLTDGLTDDKTVSEDFPHAAEALYRSTVDYYRRAGAVETTIQLIDVDGSIAYETCVPIDVY